MSLSLRTAIPRPALFPAVAGLPRCAGRLCPRPPSLWQRWWARNEGTRMEGNWYCSPDCLHDGLLHQLDSILARRPHPASPNRLPLGLVLLSQGAITHQQLRRALELQRQTGGRKIGEWLVELGAVSETQVTAALAAQQGCPLFTLQEPRPLPAAMHWPLALTDSYQAAPLLHSAPQLTLYVGFRERVSHVFLRAAEHILHCVTQPCIVSPQVFRLHRERALATAASQDTIVIQQPQSAFEMAETIVNYAEQVKARRCAVTLCEQRLWARVGVGEEHIDFLFRPRPNDMGGWLEDLILSPGEPATATREL